MGPEALDIDKSSQIIATGSYRTHDQVQLWDFGTCKLLETVDLGSGPLGQALGAGKKMMPYTCRFSSDSKRLLIGGKFVNEDNQGCLVIVNRKAGKSQVIYEEFSRESAVWSVDSQENEFVLGHADGTMGVFS